MANAVILIFWINNLKLKFSVMGEGGGGSFNRSNNFCAIVAQMVGRIHEKSYLKCWNQELF